MQGTFALRARALALAAAVVPAQAAGAPAPNPCDGAGGQMPAVEFFEGRLWCAVQADGALHLLQFSDSKAVLSSRTLPLAPGSAAFPRLLADSGALWLAYRDGDAAKLRDVAKEAERILGAAGGFDPVALGSGQVAWQGPAPEFKILVQPLAGGERVPAGAGGPSGLSRVPAPGRATTVDEERHALAEGTRPCRAGGLIAVEAPDSGVLAMVGAVRIPLFQGATVHSPRCAAGGGRYAVAAWSEGRSHLAVFSAAASGAAAGEASAPGAAPATEGGPRVAASAAAGGSGAPAGGTAPAPSEASARGGLRAQGANLSLPAPPPAPSTGSAPGTPPGAGPTGLPTIDGPRNVAEGWIDPRELNLPPINTCEDPYKRCAREGAEECLFAMCRGAVWMVRNTSRAYSCSTTFTYKGTHASQWRAWADGVAQEVLEACKDVCHVGHECEKLPPSVDKKKLLASFERYWDECISYKGISCICNPNEGVCRQFRRFMGAGRRSAYAKREDPGSGSSGGGGSEGSGGPPKKPAKQRCKPPNKKAVVEEVRARPGMDAALRRACRNNTDWTFPDAVLDELRKTDLRWGYLCRRGKCGDPSHDVLSYYCGSGMPKERSDNIAAVDYISASCYDRPEDSENPGIAWTVLEPNPKGQAGWTSRGRF